MTRLSAKNHDVISHWIKSGSDSNPRTFEINPEVVGVEDLELANGLEVLDVFIGDLCNFEQTDCALIINEGTTLDICFCLVRDLHDELGLRIDHVPENALINTG